MLKLTLFQKSPLALLSIFELLLVTHEQEVDY